MRKIPLLAICLYFFVHAAFAAHVKGLYQGVVPVVSQSQTERNQVLQQALANVFIKVSGNSQILNQPAIKSHLADASSLMQEFSYLPSHQTKPYLLLVNFDADGVNKIFTDASIPIWGQNRPLILVLLTYEAPAHPIEIINADSATIPDIVKQTTDLRGLPVIFPMMDMQDMSQITANAITTNDMTKLSNAAKRYASDAILVGRVIQNPTGVTTQWKLMMGTDQWGWNITGRTLPDIFASLSTAMGDALASRLATVVTNTVQTQLTLNITGVSEGDDFEQMMNYLKHLTPVADVALVRVTENSVILKINLRGSANSFTKAVFVGQRLTPQVGNNNDGLSYQWNH